MTILYNEKQAPLNIADYDINFTEIRDVINLVNSHINQTDVLNDDVDNVVQIINSIQNNNLKSLNNLSDLQSITSALLNLNVYSSLYTENTYYKIEDNLDNVSQAETRQNLEIGSNALRDLNFIRETEDHTPVDFGVNGDLLYNQGIFDGFVYDDNSFGIDTDNKVMNFDLLDGDLSNIKNLPDFSLSKVLHGDDYIFSSGTQEGIYVFNKNNLNNYTEITNIESVETKDFEVLPKGKYFFNNENIIAVYIERSPFPSGVANATLITDSFKIISLDYSSNTDYNTEAQHFNNVIADVADNEKLYFTTENYLIKVDLTNPFLLFEERFSLDTAPARDSNVCAVDDTYFYYLSTSNLRDLYRVNKTTGAVSLFNSFSNNVLKIITDENNNLYFMTTGQLIKKDNQNNTIWTYNITRPTPANIDFDISYNNEIFISGNGYIIKLDENKNEIFVKNTPGRFLNKICLFPGKYNNGFWNRRV